MEPKPKDQTTNAALSFITGEMQEIITLRDSFKAEQVAFIKNLVNKDLTDTELYLFLMFAGKIGLNPFKKEIIAVVYHKDNPAERRVGYIVTRDGKMVVARGKIEQLRVRAIYIKTVKGEDGTEITIETAPYDGKLWGGHASCIRDGQEYEVTVPLSEYDSNKNVWATKKSTMIKKVAQSQLLSMAVPELLGGVAEEEEMQLGSSNGIAQLPDGDSPAGADQLASIAQLGGDTERTYTKQEAAQAIKELALSKKGANHGTGKTE